MIPWLVRGLSALRPILSRSGAQALKWCGKWFARGARGAGASRFAVGTRALVRSTKLSRALAMARVPFIRYGAARRGGKVFIAKWLLRGAQGLESAAVKYPRFASVFGRCSKVLGSRSVRLAAAEVAILTAETCAIDFAIRGFAALSERDVKTVHAAVLEATGLDLSVDELRTLIDDAMLDSSGARQSADELRRRGSMGLAKLHERIGAALADAYLLGDFAALRAYVSALSGRGLSLHASRLGAISNELGVHEDTVAADIYSLIRFAAAVGNGNVEDVSSAVDQYLDAVSLRHTDHDDASSSAVGLVQSAGVGVLHSIQESVTAELNSFGANLKAIFTNEDVDRERLRELSLEEDVAFSVAVFQLVNVLLGGYHPDMHPEYDSDDPEIAFAAGALIGDADLSESSTQWRRWLATGELTHLKEALYD